MGSIEGFEHLKVHLKAIISATGNFSTNNLIGKGGFGMVFKGELSHSKGHTMAAFKRLDRTQGQGNPEFWKEIMMLSRYTHKNLVSLLGFCNEGVEKILVYEYASHGSLDRYLSSTSLTWTQRLVICLGAASGLCYLHDPEGTQHRLLHCDIKSSNILLDENWNAKVSDFGLSKNAPANQQYTFLVTNARGTFAYCDPLYTKMGYLTKESDVYSFGVVLFEVMCGRLCYEYSEDGYQILVRMWLQCYEEEKLDELILPDLRKQMDLSSLNTFSAIAYQCLKKSREERPTMTQVVKELKIALEFQENFEAMKAMDYEDIIKTAVPPLIYRSKEELNSLLSNGILLDGGKTWFSLKKKEENCEMISATKCLFSSAFDDEELLKFAENSRFPEGTRVRGRGEFKARVKTQFLSPHVTYTVNLVFKMMTPKKTASKITYIALIYKLAGEENQYSTSYLADEREDGWLMAELYQFTSQRNVDLEIWFEYFTDLLVIEGIEFRPVDKVKHEELEDQKVDMQPISDQNIDWKRKVPNDYKELIKLAEHGFWASKIVWKAWKYMPPTKELYLLLRKGFLIDNGEKWFSIGENGKKCYMIQARAALLERQCTWMTVPKKDTWPDILQPHSRFQEVAKCNSRSFDIVCEIKSQLLSPQITYASYLVYKLPNYHILFRSPVKVSHRAFLDDEWFIYLLSPQTPVIGIGPKVHQKTYNSINRPKMEGLPKLRSDGWMEVQLWKFRIGATNGTISMHLCLTTFYEWFFHGIVVQGIEFKPI